MACAQAFCEIKKIQIKYKKKNILPNHRVINNRNIERNFTCIIHTTIIVLYYHNVLFTFYFTSENCFLTLYYLYVEVLMSIMLCLGHMKLFVRVLYIIIIIFIYYSCDDCRVFQRTL